MIAYPPIADLQTKPEPVFPEEALTDPDAFDKWTSEALLWGRDGWLQVGRLCRYFQGHGMEVDC